MPARGITMTAPACPHCQNDIPVRALQHQSLLATCRTCPDCGGLFTVDAKTRQRQGVALIVALIAFALTLLLIFRGLGWLLPAAAGYALLGAVIYRGNRHVRFVPVQRPEPRAR